MSNLLSPFSSDPSVINPVTKPRFPINQPLSANTLPNVNYPILQNLTSSEISTSLTVLNFLNDYIGLTNNNTFNFTSLQETAIQSTLTLFGTLTADTAYTFSILQLQYIVIVAQLCEALYNANINLQTGATMLDNTLGIKTAHISTAGNGYVSGTYTNIPLTGGSGTGATANITVTSTLTALFFSSNGSGLISGTYHNVPLVGGSGSGALATVIVTSGSGIQTGTISNTGANYNPGTYLNVNLTGGSGSGAQATIVVTGQNPPYATGAAISVTITNPGTGYVVNDTLSCGALNGGNPPTTGSGFVYTVNTLTATATSATITTAGSNYAQGDILTIPASSLGGGTNSTEVIFSTTVVSPVTSVTMYTYGFGYLLTDSLSVLSTNLGAATALTNVVITPATMTTSMFQVPPSPFPSGACTIVANDGYFIVEVPGTGQWWVSQNQDGTQWNALTYAVIESRSDTVVAVDAFQGGLVVIFGSRSMEFWSDQGLYPFPYQRQSGQQMDWGLAAKWSRAYCDNSIIFLGQQYQGQIQVLEFEGSVPTPVSNPDIEFIINSFPVVDDAIALSYVYNGHEFYCLTFPTANRTFLYDATTDLWAEWQSSISDYNRHLSNFGVTYNTCGYVSDAGSGNIYFIDPLNYTDNGSLIRREVTSCHIQDESNDFGIDEIYLFMQNGVGMSVEEYGDDNNPMITLSVSKDGGNTYKINRPKSMGLIGQYYNPRVIWRSLGKSRDFVLKFVCTSAVPFIISFATATPRKGIEQE